MALCGTGLRKYEPKLRTAEGAGVTKAQYVACAITSTSIYLKKDTGIVCSLQILLIFI